MRIQVERGETLFFDQHFTKKTVYIGRLENCDIHLPADESVSNRHLMVFEEKNAWFIEPLHDPYHRSYLNGHLLRERQSLKDGDEIVAGDFRILVFPSDRAEDRAVAVQVAARSKSELQDTLGLSSADMGLPEDVIVKNRTETFSLSRGRMEYLSGLTLKMLEYTDVRALMSAVIDALLADLQASCVWIGLRTDDEGHLHLSAGKDITGRAIDAPEPARESSNAVVECGRAVLYQSSERLPERSAMAAPLVSPDGSIGMVYLESQSNKQKFNVADLDTLVFLGTQMAIALDKLLREQTEQLEQIRSLDQELARKVQTRMAPWKLPQWPGLQLAVLAEQGTGQCSDFYEVVPLADKQGMILIGQTGADETDSAISMAEVCAAFRIGAVHQDMPQVLMRQINWLVSNTRTEPRRISAGMLSINPQSGKFIISLAGNIFGYLIDDTGKAVKIKEQGNQLIGEARKSKYKAAQGRLAPGQTLVLCTGGIFKLRSLRRDSFQEQQLIDLLSDSSTQPVAGILSDLADDISVFTSGKKPELDVTVLMLRKAAGRKEHITGPSGAAPPAGNDK